MEEYTDLLNEFGISFADFSIWWILAGLVFSSVGLYLLRQAKKRGNFYWGAIGLTLLLYTYFITNPYLCWLIGTVLCALAYATRKLT